MITKKISELFHIFNGMTSVSKKWQSEGNCQFIDYLNVFNNLSVDTSKLNYATVKSHKQNILLKGDILFTSSSETIDECGLSSVIEQDIKDGIFLDDHLFGIRIRTSYRDFLNPSYLKYYFRCGWFRKEIKKSVKGITRFYIKKSLFEDLQIPIPPIEVQNKIVEILDKFTNYKAELTAELTFREEQYKYYRNILINKYINKNAFVTTLGKVTLINKFKQPQANELEKMIDINGNIPLLPSSRNYNWFTTLNKAKKWLSNGNVITLGRARNPNIKKCEGYFVSSNNIIIQSFDEKILSYKYLYYFLDNIKESFYVESASYPKFDKNIFDQTKIQIPPIEVQNKIVEILDKFNSLINNISEGLPKEIGLRDKQYEYYRNLLLDFKEK